MVATVLTKNMILLSALLLCLANSAGVQAQRNGDLRLARGSISNSAYSSGRLEIFINGHWGTVCDDSFDTTDANVACQQLGFMGANSTITARDNSLFASGSDSSTIWLDDVDCFGNESCLLSCSYNGIGVHNCAHSEDVAIFCSGSRSSSTNCSFISTKIAACNDTDIRLVGGGNELEGRVEVCFHGQWETVCDDSWDITDASVVCRQLGLTPDYAIPIYVREGIFSSGNGPIFLDEVACRGNETNLADCPHRGVGIHDCVHFEDAGVICPQAPTCDNSEVRLVGGRNEYEGRVEICQRGSWGTVCDDNWDDTDAMVVCRQLGISASATRQANRFGPGIGPIFLDDVGCRGNEASLDVCPHRGIGIHNCDHSEDAGVICFHQAPSTAIIIGASLGGALLLVIVLLVMVIIIALVVVQKKKAAVRSIQLDVLASPPNPRAINQDSTFIESGAACNPLSQKEASLMADDSVKVGNVVL